MKKIVCLMGPTASGKTQLAIELLKYYPFEIISVDSALVYRTLDIGTAKPAKEILAQAPHHLIDIRDPSDAYSAADFLTDATALSADIISRQKIPLLVGGTMLYFRALQCGLAAMPSADDSIRQRINAEASECGWSAMHAKLKKVDPEAGARIHENDTQRIQRALEVFMLSGQTMTDLQRPTKNCFPFEIINVAILPNDRAVLHKRIEHRFDAMLKQGFIQEVELCRANQKLHADMPSMRSVGYRQVWQYLTGELDEMGMRENAIAATRQLAKRQLTWLRNWPKPLKIFDSEDSTLLMQVESYLSAHNVDSSGLSGEKNTLAT
jgi:tRNA dimethylallyltransferase